MRLLVIMLSGYRACLGGEDLLLSSLLVRPRCECLGSQLREVVSDFAMIQGGLGFLRGRDRRSRIRPFTNPSNPFASDEPPLACHSRVNARDYQATSTPSVLKITRQDGTFSLNGASQALSSGGSMFGNTGNDRRPRTS